MSNEQGLGAVTEASWTSFRGRLADHVAVMDDDDVLVVEFDGVVPEGEGGSAPYVQLCAYDDTLVRLEAVSNEWLDARCELSVDDEEALAELGWCAPTDDAGWENFYLTFERRSADEVAVLVVRTLREVYGVPHPAFLLAAGLEIDPDVVAPRPEPRDPSADTDATTDDDDDDDDDEKPERLMTVARGRAHLQSMVDAAMRSSYPDLTHDADGDIPISSGRSRVFVRVLGDHPSIEIFADLVLGAVDVERLPLELDLLNSSHPLWKFYAVDTTVTMRFELLAMPFSRFQLLWMVSRFVHDVDAIARDLCVRVGGRRFLEPEPADVAAVRRAYAGLASHPAMTGLLELLHLDRVRPSTVAGLFEHDRLEIINLLVAIRTGRQSCDEHDPEVVLDVLRKALRIVSDGDPGPGRPVALPPRPRSVQESLLSDGDLDQDALDLGWTA